MYNVPHVHSSVTAPHQEQYSTSTFMTNTSLECLKQLENRATPTPFPTPRQKTKQKKSCFCQASTEYTAFHFIKTIIQKPAKNYIKLPPCTTPSPFPQPLSPANSLLTLQGQDHTRDCSKLLTSPWPSHPTHSIFQTQAVQLGGSSTSRQPRSHITTALPWWSVSSRFFPRIWQESSIQQTKPLTNPYREINDDLTDFLSNSHPRQKVLQELDLCS